jgi:mannitol-1-phosphate 5-dehydrogenase
MSKPKALHFGAGNIGRGFIGPLLIESGYHVVFTDVIRDIIEELNKRDTYNVHILDEQEHLQPVSSFSGIISTSDDVIHVIADPNVRLVTTAVGPNILPRIAPTIAKGLHARHEANAGPLNIIACENMVGGTALLAGHVSQHLSPEDKSWVDQHIGFANCSVDRIVPPAKPEDNPLDVVVEGFYEWVVDQTGLKSTIEPKVEGMKLTGDLSGYIERKLFTLNCGHAIAAYLGNLKGYKTIDQAIRDPQIRSIVRGAMVEGGAALVKKHGFNPSEHEKYVDKIVTRFENSKLKDDVVRVGRQPLRKLGKADRLVGPTNMAKGYGFPIDNLTQGIAAAFLYDVEEDEQSVELQQKLAKVGIAKAVEEIAGFQEGSEEHRLVVEAYGDLGRNHNRL